MRSSQVSRDIRVIEGPQSHRGTPWSSRGIKLAPNAIDVLVQVKQENSGV